MIVEVSIYKSIALKQCFEAYVGEVKGLIFVSATAKKSVNVF